MRMSSVAQVVTCALVVCSAHGATRLSEYGSNPYLSWVLFPQDLQAWHSNFMAFYPGYEKSPYWGDIDEPLNKPNGNYTSTGLDLIEGDIEFKHTAKVHSSVNDVTYMHRISPEVIGKVDLNYDIDTRYTRAEGTFQDAFGNPLPFSYTLAHAIGDLNLQGALGFELFGMPTGFRLKIGYENTLLYRQNFEFTQRGQPYETERATWGWSTSGCAHIFGVSPIQGDAWLQDGYARGPVYEFDMQGGMTLPRARVGARFAYRAGHQDTYRWRADSSRFLPDTSDSVIMHTRRTINNNFMGDYRKQDWSSTISDAVVRAYANVPLVKSDRFTFNTFVLAGYDGALRGQALSGNSKVAGGNKDKVTGARLEIAPNVLIPFGSAFSYIDAAVVLGYDYSRFSNRYLRWVGGGQIETYVNSTVAPTDEDIWHGYSYANRSAVSAGLDLSTMFPLIDNGTQRLGLGFELLINSAFTFMTKYYGTNLDRGADVDFRVDNRREDYEREVQFGTGLKLQYQRRPYMMWLEVTEPLLHALLPRTRVTDASGENVSYEHEKAPLWMSLEGMRVGVFFSYEVTLRFLGGT